MSLTNMYAIFIDLPLKILVKHTVPKNYVNQILPPLLVEFIFRQRQFKDADILVFARDAASVKRAVRSRHFGLVLSLRLDQEHELITKTIKWKITKSVVKFKRRNNLWIRGNIKKITWHIHETNSI